MESIASTTGPIYTSNLCAPFFDAARRWPRRAAVIYEGETYSYADLVAQTDAAVDLLREIGVAAGDRVAVFATNHPAILVVLFALARIGAVHLPLNPRCSLYEVRKVVADADISALVVGSPFQERVAPLRAELPGLVCVSIEQSYADWPVLSILGVRGGDGLSRHLICLTDAADLAVVLYTSGTTGEPKGVMISHGNAWAMLLNIYLTTPITAASTVLCVAPMFHVGALYYALAALGAGGCAVILPGFEVEAVYAALERWSISFTFCVPTMLHALQNHPQFATQDFSKLMIMAAGAPVPVATLRQWLERGARIVQGYGMTEGGATVLDADRCLDKVGSAGMPAPLTEVQIRDLRSGEPIDKPDINGQIFMRGAAISRGYWRRPAETAAAIDSDGWLATGDVGRWDAEGFIYIVDRIKDMIISGGMNVYPAEVEKAIGEHAGVAAVAVIGLADEKWGERVTAVIVRKAGDAGAQVGAEELRVHCGERLASHKVPQQFEFVDALPLGASGKVLKARLRGGFGG